MRGVPLQRKFNNICFSLYFLSIALSSKNSVVSYRGEREYSKHAESLRGPLRKGNHNMISAVFGRGGRNTKRSDITQEPDPIFTDIAIEEPIESSTVPVPFPTPAPSPGPSEPPSISTPVITASNNSLAKSPTRSPTLTTELPTKLIPNSPTIQPTKSPTQYPTKSPTELPIKLPTKLSIDSHTEQPTKSPTKYPIKSPSESLTELLTVSPSKSIQSLIESYTQSPTKSLPESSTKLPSDFPTEPLSNLPTRINTQSHTISFSQSPTMASTEKPTQSPTKSPTKLPTEYPTVSLTKAPTVSPTKLPTQFPTKIPTKTPTVSPTKPPTKSPTQSPTNSPTILPFVFQNIGDTFITPDEANELVVIPEPVFPIESTSRRNCPHKDKNLLDWHLSSTWNGPIPYSGDVTLPNNSRVILRQSIETIFGKITIPPTSELLFGENENGIAFDTHGIDVKGKLTIGSETCRIETPVTITLHGNRPYDIVKNERPPTFKGISVTGEINIHGKHFYQTWTRLAKTVEPGDKVVFLQHEVNWMPNQEIVLVTTAMKDSREWHRNEISIVESVIKNVPEIPGIGSAVILKSPVSYQHLANSGYQGEVGLLSRQIIVQGNEESEPTDADPLNCSGQKSIFGDNSQPCVNTNLTGFGGHIIVQGGGKGFVEGVELFRMGQTNVLGRYPMHFHLLEDNCPGCYFRDSSIHRSFYRCVSIHGTHNIKVSRNVAFDITGFCYYLEDGVERNNRIDFNLGAHIHMIGPGPPRGEGQKIPPFTQNENLTLPADVSASAFYITNVHNIIIGNAASGGWSGFTFPILQEPLGPYRGTKVRPPLSETSLQIDGNTVHSTGWWWKHSGGFYLGGTLYYNSNGVLEYNAGRDLSKKKRLPCLVDKCKTGHKENCNEYCQPHEQAWIKLTNLKAFLIPGVGLNSWNGRTEIIGYECHDCGLFLQALSTDGFWGHNMLGVCRSKTPIILPGSVKASSIPGNGFRWYDTGQEHIITNVKFRNCGYRSDEFDQYNNHPDRGCGDEFDIGCERRSSVWSFVTHSDQHVPEMMQATKNVIFENCGRYFYYHDFRRNPISSSSNSGRLQNWFDYDGSITGIKGRSIIASGLASAGMWWSVDDDVITDAQGPLKFFQLHNNRGLGHFRMRWDEELHDQIGDIQCGNGKRVACETVGYIKHIGDYFTDDPGLPITANGDLVGPVGGFGWKLKLESGAPKSIVFEQIEVDPSTPMLLSIAYPQGTNFTIVAHAGYCREDTVDISCTETFYRVGSLEEVRSGIGNTYYVDSLGVLTLRIIQTPKTFVGRPDFFLPNYDDIGKEGKGFALPRFERDRIRLPKFSKSNYLSLKADCTSTGAYCSIIPSDFEPTVCPLSYKQTGYDHCTSTLRDGARRKFYAGDNI